MTRRHRKVPIAMSATIRHDAASKKQGMTLVDLERFVTAARQAGATDQAQLRIGVGFSGQVQYAEVKIAQESTAAPYPPDPRYQA